MHARIALGAALAATLLLSGTSAAAPTPVMDGKKVRSLTLQANGGTQAHDQDAASLESTERITCGPPRCASLKFVYKPATGVRDGLMFSARWANPASDIDLYVGQVSGSGRVTELAHCGGAATTSEKIFIPAKQLKSGHTYILVTDFYRSLDEDVTATVAFGPDATAKTVPADADMLIYPVNCTL